ncbi:hypothetical protein D3C81_1374060 [compost metagenome]
MATLQQQLVATVFKSFLYLLFVAFNIGNVAIFMTRATEKIAKFAICNTHIGGIDISVDLPGYFTMWHLYLTQFIGYESQISCRCVLI